MSASSKKKLRKEQEAAAMTERQKAAQKEAKKLKIYTWSFWIVMILIVAIVAGIALKGPVNVVIDRVGTAIVVGEHKISTTELNYFYIDAINDYCSEYSSYISYLIDTSSPLSEQVVDATTGSTWADTFLDMAISNAKNTYALYDAAKAAGHTLSADEKSVMDELYDSMDSYAEQLGYRNATKYLQAIYGDSASKSSYQDYYEVTILASSYYSAHSEQLKDSYKEVDLRDYESETPYEYNSYSYASFYLNLDKFKTGGTKDANGDITYTEAEIAAAEEALKAAAEGLADPENNTVEKLNAAIAEMEKAMAEAEKEEVEESTDKTEATEETVEPEAQTADGEVDTSDETDVTEPEEGTESEDAEATDPEDEKKEETSYSTCTESTDVLYSKISSVMNEWIRDEARVEGDITALEYSTTSTDSDGNETKTLKGYYVVLYLGVNDNNYALSDVRHILISFEGGSTDSTTGTTTYSDAEKTAAKTKAEALLDEWKAGAATEDSFAALANKNSTDPGSNTNGGLYEDVYPGQMVTSFNDWCFDDARQAGDTGIVESSYGYHVMYYVGDSEQNYRDFMIINDMLTEDMEEWQTALNDAMSLTEKNTSRVDKDIVLSNSGII